jgi:hypothetical protein
MLFGSGALMGTDIRRNGGWEDDARDRRRYPGADGVPGSAEELVPEDIGEIVIDGIGVWSKSNECRLFGYKAPAARQPLLCRFLDAGMTRGASHSGGRRPKSAKARSREKFGAGWAASAMGI